MSERSVVASVLIRTAQCVLFLPLLIVLVTLLSPRTLLAEGRGSISLPRDVPFADHVRRHFGHRDGLPSTWIYDLVQTQDGLIWIATHNGLAKYDGLRFRGISRSNTPELPANDTRVLYESSDGSLWIGTVGGLLRYQPGRPGRFERVDEFTGNSILAVLEDSRGRLWVGTREATWLKPPGDDFQLASRAPRQVHAICEDSLGDLWFGASEGLYRLHGDDILEVEVPRLTMAAAGTGLARATVTALLADGSGVWVGTSHGLLRVEQTESPSNGSEIGQVRVNDLYRTQDGTIYAATGNGLFRLDEAGFVQVEAEPRAKCILEDHEGGLWIGHVLDRGLSNFQRREVKTFLAEHRVNCVHADGQGSIWLGTFDGLHQFQDGTLTSFGTADGLPDVNVTAICGSDDRTLWIGTRRGLVRWNGTKLVPVADNLRLEGLGVNSILVDSEGVLWISTAGSGALRVQDGSIERISELDHGQVAFFYEDPNGTLWIGHEYGLYQFVTGRLREVTESSLNELNTQHFRCFFAEPDGTLWLGTPGGLVRHRSGRFEAVTSRNGLAADYIDCIQEDANGNFWFTGRDGIFHAKSSSLHAVASGERDRVACRRLEPAEGVPVSNSAPKSHLTAAGEMWMVAKHGVIRVSAERWEEPPPPAVIIEQVQVDARTVPADRRVEFRSGRQRLAIDFSVPKFRNSRDVRVRYRLNGSDERWTETTNERVAYYTDLLPGDYRFEISAASGDVWSQEGTTVDLTVHPQWWQRFETRVLAVLCIIASAIFYARYRTRKVRRANIALRREIEDRKRAEEQSRRHQDELSRIARAASLGEMATSIAHEIRQPLFAIMTDARTANRLLHREPTDIAEIEDALEGIASGGNRASEIVDRIQSLVRKEESPRKWINLNQIAEAAIAFLQPELRRRHVDLETDLSPNLPPILGDEIQLQQVLINLIINGAQAMKSNDGPRPLQVSTGFENGLVSLAVRDAGVGIDETQVDQLFEPFYTTKTSGIGMGLAINRTIVRSHGGEIGAANNNGPGATFQIQVPCDPLNEEQGLVSDN